MGAPSSALTVQRSDLAAAFEEFDTEMDRLGYVGQKVLRPITVQRQAGQFAKIPIEQLLQNRDTKRAPGSGYARGDFQFETANFATEEHGAEEPLDDREKAMYAELYDGELIAVNRAMTAVMVNQEKRAAALLWNATTWTGAALTTAITNEWDDAANAVPMSDVEAAIRKVYDGSGLWPNALIVNRKVFRNLRLCDEIQALVKSQGFMDVRPGAITEQQLATALGIDMVIVAGGTKNSAIEGQSASPAQIWSDEYAMVAKVATTNDFREPCVGRIFHWPGDGSDIDGMVEQYRDETVRSDIYRVRHDVDEIVLYAQAAHLLSNVTT